MKASDFMYDNILLSSFGCVICSFDSIGLENVSAGSVISFNTTPINYGQKFMLTSSEYDECLNIEFDICKDPCVVSSVEEQYFSLPEQREIMRWLNRSKFYKFKIIDEDYEDIYFEGSFNIEKIESCGQCVGMHLKFESNRPFGVHEDIVYDFEIDANGSYTIDNISDDDKYIYPDIKITCNASGTLSITNSFDGRVFEIKNCSKDEVIIINRQMILTNSAAHYNTLASDCNYNFIRLCNSYSNHENTLTFSLPASVQMKYNPIRKVGI